MRPQLTLSSKGILDKVFQTAPRGYNPLEVDSFLDLIIKDYVVVESNVLAYKKDIEALEQEVEKLKKENYELQVENGKYKDRFANIKEGDVVTSDNMNLVKRINKLETFLYKNGFNPQDI